MKVITMRSVDNNRAKCLVLTHLYNMYNNQAQNSYLKLKKNVTNNRNKVCLVQSAKCNCLVNKLRTRLHNASNEMMKSQVIEHKFSLLSALLTTNIFRVNNKLSS